MIAGAVPEVQQHAPDKVRRKTAGQHHAQFRQASPESRSARRLGGAANGVARRQRERKARAHDAGEGRNHEALLEIEFLDDFPFLVLGHFVTAKNLSHFLKDAIIFQVFHFWKSYMTLILIPTFFIFP